LVEECVALVAACGWTVAGRTGGRQMAKSEIEQLPQPAGFDREFDRLEDATVTWHLKRMRDLDDTAWRTVSWSPPTNSIVVGAMPSGAIRRW
jgi:hypothetical protein